MDVLESGSDRPSTRDRAGGLLGRVGALARRRLPRWAVSCVATAAAVTTAAGALAVAPVADRIDRTEQETARAAALAAEPDLAARPLGGTAIRTGAGAAGLLALEVRNGRQPLTLLSVSGQVPGVQFGPVSYRGGRALATDERLELRLSYVVPDCAALRRSGELVLRVIAGGAERDLTLPVVADPQTGTARRFDLDVVLDACG